MPPQKSQEELTALYQRNLDAVYCLCYVYLRNHADTEDAVQSAYAVNKSDSNQNDTLEVKQVIGDGNLVYLLLKFTAPEGVRLNQDDYRFSGALQAAQQTTAAGFFKITDENENDNKITLIMCEPTREPALGKCAVLELYDLEGANNVENYQIVLSHNWRISFPLNFDDCSIVYPVKQTLSAEGYDITLQSISVSPLSITLRANSP
ncbi:RNA polymerase sigma factor [Candidatus Agathobaculum pullicola]|uniref:RNA polymerase sigma factor n=1 Tax=Candidatus Agathobaculum pullicola TaxID=2838426 RepID=UPI003F92F8C3